MRHVLVVCEARGDFEVATALCERVLRERGPDWHREYMEHSFEHVLAWVGTDATRPFLRWRDLASVRAALGVRPPLGRFSGERGAPDALAARTALAIARHLRGARPPQRIDAVVLVRDLDDQPERRDGLEQARTEARGHVPEMPVLIGAAFPEIEAWLIEGFEPESKEEESLLAQLRQEIGFDPRMRTSALAAKHDHDRKGCKRVLRVLTQASADRTERCIRETPLDVLTERGVASGLAQLLAEAESVLLPLCLASDAERSG